MRRTFSGTWPALVTPATPEGQVNVPVLRQLVEYLIEKNVDGLYVCGTTGEGIFMSLEERQLVLEEVLHQVSERIPVIVHVGSVSVNDATALAIHANQVGAAGVSSILPPLYRTPESLYCYFASIAAAAPDLPLLSYIFGGPDDAVSLLRRLMEIPTLVGTKYTGPNMFEFRQIVELRNRDWTVFSGMDEQCAFAAMFGARGNIGSTLNFMPGVYREIHACCRRGDLDAACKWQLRANRVTQIMISYGFPGALREVLRHLGFECGTPRLPNLPLSEEQRDHLLRELEDAGLAELAAM